MILSELWMPPMQRVIELEERYGITGHIDQEPIVGAGDLARTEHVLHELSHAVLLFENFDGERHLSEAIPLALHELKPTSECPKPLQWNELESFAVEMLVLRSLGMPIDQASIVDALAMQVSGVLDCYVQWRASFVDAQDTGHIQEAADRVCAIVAPDGRARRPRYAEGSVFWRRTEDDHEIVVYPMTFGNARLCIGEPDDSGYFDAWCYQSDRAGKGFGESGLQKAIRGAAEWNGEGDDPPGGWYRNPRTGRRRPGGDKEQEHVQW